MLLEERQRTICKQRQRTAPGRNAIPGSPICAPKTSRCSKLYRQSLRLEVTSTEGEPIRHDNFYRRHFRPAVLRRYCVECDATVKPDAEDCPECDTDEFAYVLHPSKHGLRFHDLRHTCASLLIAQGAHPKAIQDHLGHKDIQTTFNVYGHLLPSVHEALGASLDAAYEGSADSDDDDEQHIPRIGPT